MCGFPSKQASVAKLLVEVLEVLDEHVALHERRVRARVPRILRAFPLGEPVRLESLSFEDNGWRPRGTAGADGGDYGGVLTQPPSALPPRRPSSSSCLAVWYLITPAREGAKSHRWRSRVLGCNLVVGVSLDVALCNNSVQRLTV